MSTIHQRICAEVLLWLEDPENDNLYDLVMKSSDHIATCPTCRGAFFLVANELLQRPAFAVSQINCDDCQRDLAPYIDLMAERNERIAAHRYPHVWWHLGTCAACAETYQLTMALIKAEADGVLEPFAKVTSHSIPV